MPERRTEIFKAHLGRIFICISCPHFSFGLSLPHDTSWPKVNQPRCRPRRGALFCRRRARYRWLSHSLPEQEGGLLAKAFMRSSAAPSPRCLTSLLFCMMLNGACQHLRCGSGQAIQTRLGNAHGTIIPGAASATLQLKAACVSRMLSTDQKTNSAHFSGGLARTIWTTREIRDVVAIDEFATPEAQV